MGPSTSEHSTSTVVARNTTTHNISHLPHEAFDVTAATTPAATTTIVNVFTTLAPTSTSIFLLQTARVSVQMTVQHVDHSGLSVDPDLYDAFKSRIRSAIADEAGHGISPSQVHVTLAKGSVKIDATINDLDGAVAFLVQTNMESASNKLGRRVEEQINAIEGLGAVATGPVTVSDIIASSAITSEGGEATQPEVTSQFNMPDVSKLMASVEESVKERLPPALKQHSQGAIGAFAGFLVCILIVICVASAGKNKGHSPAAGSQDPERDDDYQHLALVNPDELEGTGMYDVDPTTDPGHRGKDTRTPMPEEPLEDEDETSRGGARGLGMHEQEPPESAPSSNAPKRPGAAGPRKKDKAAAAPPAAPAANPGDDALASFLRLAEEMGFTQEQALQALDQHDGNSEAALESLLAPA